MINHYEYLKKFFKDVRYIYKDNKPIILIYRPDVKPNVNDIINCCNNLSINDGFKGLTFINVLKLQININKNYYYFNYVIDNEFSFCMTEYFQLKKCVIL